MFKSSKKPILEFKNVSFGYKPKQTILSDISFSIFENEHVAIIGSNGCGKSTLGKVIVGLFKPHSGDIYFKNKKIDKLNVNKYRHACGMVFDNPDAQFVGLTVQDDIAFGLENQMLPHNKMQEVIDEVSKYTGVFDLLKSSPLDLSGGQKQLVAITSVLAMKPDIIVFDEVTSMLDNPSKKTINSLINSLQKKQHKTIISITHDMDEALQADRIIIMNKGKIVSIANPKQTFSKDIKDLSLDKPFIFKLSEQLGIKPISNLDKLVEEIIHEK